MWPFFADALSILNEQVRAIPFVLKSHNNIARLLLLMNFHSGQERENSHNSIMKLEGEKRAHFK
jgi:hypothetical protein